MMMLILMMIIPTRMMHIACSGSGIAQMFSGLEVATKVLMIEDQFFFDDPHFFEDQDF